MKGGITIKLSKTEVNHILTLINQNENEGWYFGPKDQYWKRSERIKKHLELSEAPKAEPMKQEGLQNQNQFDLR